MFPKKHKYTVLPTNASLCHHHSKMCYLIVGMYWFDKSIGMTTICYVENWPFLSKCLSMLHTKLNSQPASDPSNHTFPTTAQGGLCTWQFLFLSETDNHTNTLPWHCIIGQVFELLSRSFHSSHKYLCLLSWVQLSPTLWMISRRLSENVQLCQI